MKIFTPYVLLSAQLPQSSSHNDQEERELCMDLPQSVLVKSTLYNCLCYTDTSLVHMCVSLCPLNSVGLCRKPKSLLGADLFIRFNWVRKFGIKCSFLFSDLN